MTVYTERLRPSLLLWLLIGVAAVIAGSALWPIDATVGLIAALVAALLTAVALTLSRSRIEVDATGVRAGSAFLEAVHLGEVDALDASATRQALGPELRADAWLLHRFWVKTAVRVEVVDDRDPTPYWILSTTRPHELARALVDVRDAAGQAAHSEQTG